jgi:Domain of unknown function (DUF758)
LIDAKAFFAVDSGKVTWNDIIRADAPLRAGLNLFKRCYDHAKYSLVVDEEQLREKLDEVEKEFRRAADTLAEIMGPHMKPKNLARIASIVDCVGNADVLFRAFQNDTVEDDVQRLVDASVSYTQFHFYPDD